MLIYVAGPLSEGTGECKEENVIKAVEIAEQLYERGHWAYVPHLTYYQHLIIQKLRPGYVPEYGRWLAFDDQILARCDALYFIGHSFGADHELERAKSLYFPIYYKIEDVPQGIDGAVRRMYYNYGLSPLD